MCTSVFWSSQKVLVTEWNRSRWTVLGALGGHSTPCPRSRLVPTSHLSATVPPAHLSRPTSFQESSRLSLFHPLPPPSCWELIILSHQTPTSSCTILIPSHTAEHFITLNSFPHGCPFLDPGIPYLYCYCQCGLEQRFAVGLSCVV